ncbi:MAG: N-6 DNA methylase [Candidatus Competibacteraceae bacterium]|nr:N-6 DNA methylase [Candidatus Competibacteraceae bacterium]
MTAYRHREETLNTQLAILLAEFGLDADAETIHAQGRARPDVIFPWRGLRVVIEGKFSDHPKAQEAVFDDADERVRQGIAHLAAAVVYPAVLRETPTPELHDRLAEATLVYQVLVVDQETERLEGTPATLLDALRRGQEMLVENDIVAKTAQMLAERLSDVALLWIGQPGTCDRISILLGLPPANGETEDQTAARRVSAAKIASLIIANALIFQDQLSHVDHRVFPLKKWQDSNTIASEAYDHWRWIWRNINYAPIFQLGEQVLEEVPGGGGSFALQILVKTVLEISDHKSALRHDLMGRIYHWLLYHAKYLGTYYTSVPAATLLLKLALNRPWHCDFGDPAQLAEFKVADLACGTGTLLMATTQALTDAYILARVQTGRRLKTADLKILHRALMEDVLYGYDVLPTAVHLTASTLALLSPEITFARMNLYIMPMGLDGNTPRLGSLDFIGRDTVRTQIAFDQSQVEILQTDVGHTRTVSATVPKLDLCVMNPPFVRSVGGNLLFGSLPDERGVLQTELKKRVRNLSANITAGLGAAFVALADSHLKPGGRLAFVLPHALASGEAWGPTRQLLADRYHLEIVVSSYDADRPNFSENTELSELLFIARKRQNGEKPEATTYINLWRNPTDVFNALDVAERMKALPEGIIRSLSGSIGEAFHQPAATGKEHWHGAMFARSDLAKAFLALRQGKVAIMGKSQTLALCAIQDIGQLGYDRRDIHDAFTVSDDAWSLYPALWNHDAEKTRTLRQQENAWLHPRTQAAQKRPLKDAHQIWSMAGDILLTERLWPITHRVLAVSFDQPVLGNTWWALKTEVSPERRKALLLWLNGSLSLLAFFGSRVATRSAWMQMKKPAWAAMPVLDVRVLSDAQVTSLAAAYDALCDRELLALAKLNVDPARRAIDEALSAALALPDLSPLREMLAREPGLTGKSAVLSK